MDADAAIDGLRGLVCKGQLESILVNRMFMSDIMFLLQQNRRDLARLNAELIMVRNDRYYAERRWGEMLADMRKEFKRYACECDEKHCGNDNEYCGWFAKQISEGK